uniref:Uncharacterized protein n=1 Tax=Oryza barthii TaxID=65489 RepID=A0A0D3EL37_9ORYZ
MLIKPARVTPLILGRRSQMIHHCLAMIVMKAIQQLSSESKKLSEHGPEENSLLKEFDGNNPVTLPKLSDVVSARGLKHVWSEIKAFQELLKQRPVQKDVVLKEISINLDLWSNFFSKPSPEIITGRAILFDENKTTNTQKIGEPCILLIMIY